MSKTAPTSKIDPDVENRIMIGYSVTFFPVKISEFLSRISCSLVMFGCTESWRFRLGYCTVKRSAPLLLQMKLLPMKAYLSSALASTKILQDLEICHFSAFGALIFCFVLPFRSAALLFLGQFIYLL